MTDRHPLGCLCETCIKIKRNRASFRFQAPQVKEVGAGGTQEGAPAPTGYPTATVGVSAPPLGNTGETYSAPTAETVELVVDGGKVKQVTLRVPSAGECAVIDTLRFTVHQSTFLKTSLLDNQHLTAAMLSADSSLVESALNERLSKSGSDLSDAFRANGVSWIVSDDDFVQEASRVLHAIFGFGVTRSTGKGRDFYREAYVLGEGFGYVCIGNAGKNNQKQTMLIELSGLGCINAASGWEGNLYEFLSRVAVRPVLTRVDIAFDDFSGQVVSPEWAESQWMDERFTKCAGKHPNIERAGNWHVRTGAGVTLYIGSRKYSSIFARFYEKGKEQGDPSSPWCRAEVEFKNSDRVLPLDMLIRPSDYFIAAYPALEFLDDHRTPQRIAVKKKKAEISVSHAKRTIQHQFGKYLRVLRDLYDGDAEKLLNELVCEDPNAWPPRLLDVAKGLDTFGGLFMHQKPPMVYDIDSGRYLPTVWNQESGRYVPAVSEKPVAAGYDKGK